MNPKRLLLTLCLLPALSFGQYCATPYTVGTTDNDYIDGFELNTIHNLASGPGDGTGYTDFTAMTTDLSAGATYSMHLVNTPYFGESYRAWIDLNQDGSFTADEELFLPVTLASGEEIFQDFVLPATALPGETFLRVRCVYGTTDFDACSSETYGETEDYSIHVLGFDNDISVLSMVPIAADCELSSSEPISIFIRNLGTSDVTEFPVKYRVNGGAIVSEMFTGTIAPDDTALFTFATGADFSVDGTYNIETWSELPGDEFTPNDSATGVANNIFTYMTTGFPENICYAGGTIIPSPIAAGGIWSGDGIINPVTGELDPALVGGIGSSTDITYSFTPTDGYTVSSIPFAPHPLFDPTTASLSDDSYMDDISIGFNFEFFGITYNKLFIGSNGYIGFSAGSNSYATQHFPDPSNPNNIIAFCWTDLNPSAGGVIKYEAQGTAPYRRFIVDFKDVSHYGHPETVTAQIIIYESSNMIDLQVTDIQNDGGVMTQGIENVSGTAAYVTGALYNQMPFAMSEMGWRFAVTPCAATVTETINFIAAPVVIVDDAAACNGNTITLDAGTGAEEYAWNTGATTQTIDVTESGTFWVVYYENPSCFVTDTAEVTIYPLPPLNLGPDGITCEGTMLDADNPEDDHLWSTGATGQTIYVTESGTYSVIVTDSITGCQNFDTVSYTITPLPVAAFTVSETGPLTISCTSSSTDVLYYSWDFGDGTTSYEENPTHLYPYADVWTVQLVVSNECGADIEKTTIQVTTDVHDIDAAEIIGLYPNPADQLLHIDLGEITQTNLLITIFNMEGATIRKIENMDSENLTMSLEGIAAGNYMMVVQQDDKRYSLPFTIVH